MRKPDAAGHQRGFTLIELLVALTILAIGMAGAVLALRPNDSQLLRQEAERLSLLLQQAEEEALLSGTTYGWTPLEDGYAFERRILTLQGPLWETVQDDPLYRQRDLPPPLHISKSEAAGHLMAVGARITLDGHHNLNLQVMLQLGDRQIQLRRTPEGAYPLTESRL